MCVREREMPMDDVAALISGQIIRRFRDDEDHHREIGVMHNVEKVFFLNFQVLPRLWRLSSDRSRRRRRCIAC
jgi:hypothetical protein